MAADGAERRLLTTNGGPLAAEVGNALAEFGFGVVDADGLPAHASAKQEDLRVSDGSWACVAEVKGYPRRNAKANDLMQVDRAVRRFRDNQGRWPDAKWYVVNQSFETPPPERQRPLRGSPEVSGFAEDGGLIIDTRDLFRLREAVRAGALTKGAARELLKNATDVFQYPHTEVAGDV